MLLSYADRTGRTCDFGSAARSAVSERRSAERCWLSMWAVALHGRGAHTVEIAHATTAVVVHEDRLVAALNIGRVDGCTPKVMRLRLPCADSSLLFELGPSAS